jgi:hypothetical protein
MTYKTMLFFQSMLNYMLGIWPSSHATALCQADHFCFVPSSVSSSTDRLAPLMPLMRTSESPQPRSLRETTIAIYCTMILTTIIYTYVYIYKRYMRVYNYYHFFDWFLKKTVVRELRNKNGYWGGGKTVISWGSSAISLPPWRTLLAEATGAGQCRLTGLIGMDFSWLFGVYLLHFREITVTEEW